ncbi:MAG: DUF2267 domain-containing protein [Verrucomicrobiota bacterium]
MSESGLEVLDSTIQKTHEWINDISEIGHLDRSTSFKALRAVLHTLRDRLPVHEAAHFSAQLPMLIRGLFFDGWQPSAVPVKLSKEQFFGAVEQSIVGPQSIDAIRVTRAVFSVINHHVSSGTVEKVRSVLPRELHALWPEPLAMAV